MIVRAARDADAEGVLQLIRAERELPQWKRSALAVAAPGPASVSEPVRRLVVAEDEGRLVGFAQTAVVLGEAELEGMAVAPGCRRRGVGRLLLQEAMQTARADGARAFRLEVRRSNEAAIRLYAGLGMTVAGTRRGYYSGPVEDAMLLQLLWAEGEEGG